VGENKMALPIVYCMMEMNRLYEVKKCIDLVEPYVDEVVIVDGGSQDDSIFYLRNREGIHMFLHPWKDNFSEQRNNYLKRAREVVGGDYWALVSDPDEFFEKDLLAALPSIRDRCEKEGYNAAAFQCRSVTLKGDLRVWENLDNYWKPLFFKVSSGAHYEGNPHETTCLPGGLRCVNTRFVYEHIKQENVIWLRGCRNQYCGGGGPNLNKNNKLWVELKDIVKEVYGRELSWHEYEKELLKGNIDQRIKNWLIKVRKENGWDGSSEHRECFKLYFRIYHPEEEPEDLKGEYIP
jgi:glycosyltransferase involved in cell wall biosynthesis